MVPVAAFVLLFVAQGAVCMTLQELLGYFKNCDINQIKSLESGWSNVNPEGDWQDDPSEEIIKQHCQQRVESGKELVRTLQSCLADELKEGIPYFERNAVTMMEQMCNNDTLMEEALNNEVSSITDKTVFHNCFQNAKLGAEQMVDENNVNLLKPRWCCIWSTAWQCYDQSLQEPHPDTGRGTINHFDFFYDWFIKEMCGPEPLSEVCGTVSHNPASKGDLLYVVLFISQYDIFEHFAA